MRQALVVLGFEIVLVGAGYVVALNAQQELAFFDFVAEPGLDFDDPSGGEGNYRHGAGDIRLHDAGHIQRGSGLVLGRRCQGKLFGMVDVEIVGIEVGLDLRFGRCFGFGIGLVVAGRRAKQNPKGSATMDC